MMIVIMVDIINFLLVEENGMNIKRLE